LLAQICPQLLTRKADFLVFSNLLLVMLTEVCHSVVLIN